MSMWGSWFGGSSTQKRKDAPKKAILDLRQQLDMLQKREKHLENQMAEQEKIAKANISSNKTGLFDSHPCPPLSLPKPTHYNGGSLEEKTGLVRKGFPLSATIGICVIFLEMRVADLTTWYSGQNGFEA